MILTSIFLYYYWTTNNNLVNKLYSTSVNHKFKIFGILSAVFLAIHSIFLGIRRELPKDLALRLPLAVRLSPRPISIASVRVTPAAGRAKSVAGPLKPTARAIITARSRKRSIVCVDCGAALGEGEGAIFGRRGGRRAAHAADRLRVDPLYLERTCARAIMRTGRVKNLYIGTAVGCRIVSRIRPALIEGH